MKNALLALVFLASTTHAFAGSKIAGAQNRAKGIIHAELASDFGGYISVSYAVSGGNSLTEDVEFKVTASGKAGGKSVRCAGSFQASTISGRLLSQNPLMGGKYCKAL